MKKTFLALLIVSLGCSKSDPITPTNTCSSDVSTGLSLEATLAYTGDTFTVNGTKFCKDDLVSVLVNDQEITIADVSNTKFTFVVPSITGDSATIKVKTKEATTTVKGKLAIFPGGGTWKEVASFPVQGRAFMQQATVGDIGYVSGGNNYTGTTTSGSVINYNYSYFGDVYKYDATQNNWALLVSSDDAKNKGTAATAAGGKLFLFPSTVSGPVTTCDLTSGAFGTTGGFIGGTQAISYAPFSNGTDAVNCVIERSPTNIVGMLIRKYNTSTNQWDVVTTGPDVDQAQPPQVDFAFERSGKIYLGTNVLNSKDIQFYSFDITTNQFTTLVKASLPTDAATDIQALHYLFTINNLAYFTEVGSASLSPTSVSVRSPGPKLYMYNFKNNTFRSVSHTYPETFFRPVSFTLNNRGFSGMSVSASGTLFAYSQKFYEFTPQ